MYELGGALGDRRVPPGTNLLVVGPPLSGKRGLGFDVVAHGLSQGEPAVVVTNTDGAPRVREALQDRLSATEAPVGIVDCVSKHQGVETTERATYAAAPDDMTGAGIGLSEHLSSFDDRGEEGVRVLLSSLSPLLVYANVETAFRFLHVCTSRTKNAAGLGVHLLEADVHDEGTVSTVSQLYDGVVRTGADESPEASLPSGEGSA